MIKTYDWFRMHIKENKDASYSLYVTSFLDGPGVLSDFSPPFNEEQSEVLLSKIERSLTKGRPIGQEFLKEQGEKLYQSIFSDEIAEYFSRCLKIAEKSCGLRIELVIDPLYLRRLPWELMHNGKEFLSLSTRTPIVHTLPQKLEPYPRVPFPLGILFVTTNPIGSEVPLNIGGEIRRVCGVISNSVKKGRVHLRCINARKLRSQDFMNDLRSGEYHVLHFSSHGAFVEGLERGILELEDEEGRAIPVSIETLGTWIRDSSIQMVYLDACQTAIGSIRTPLADLSHIFLNKGVGAALAMQYSVPDKSAISFCETFYSQLVKQEPIELALCEARKQNVDLLYGLGSIEWAIPTLYLSGVDILSIDGEPISKKQHKPLPSLGIFIGREHPLDRLTEELIDQKYSVILIEGFGGIGKSSLANKLVKEVGLLFTDVCWIECRPKISYDKVVEEINEMLCYHRVGITKSELAKYTLEEKNRRIAYILEEKSSGFILVFDNFDSIKDDEDIINLIRQIGEGKKTKVLITVRMPVSIVRKQRFRRLDQLREDEAILLMQNLARQYDIKSLERADKSVFREINSRLDGHPKAIEIVVPQLIGEPLEVVLEKLPEVLAGDIGPILNWSFDMLTADEKELLLEISVFDEEVPYDALKKVHTWSYSPPIKNLVDKNLLSYDTERKLYSLHPLVREFAYSQIRRERKRKLHRQAARYFLSKEVKDPIRAIYHMYSAEDLKSAIVLTKKILEPLITSGFWIEVKRLCEEGLIGSRKINDVKEESFFLFNLGRIYHRLGNYGEAEKLYKQSLEIDEKLGDQSGISKSLGQLAVLHQLKGDYGEAEKLYRQVLTTFKKLGDQSGIAMTNGALGSMFEQQGDNKKAKSYYEKSLKIFQKIGQKQYELLAKKHLDRINSKIKRNKNG